MIWLALAFAPLHRQDWLLENLLVAVALSLRWRGYRTLRGRAIAATRTRSG